MLLILLNRQKTPSVCRYRISAGWTETIQINCHVQVQTNTQDQMTTSDFDQRPLSYQPNIYDHCAVCSLHLFWCKYEVLYNFNILKTQEVKILLTHKSDKPAKLSFFLEQPCALPRSPKYIKMQNHRFRQNKTVINYFNSLK